MQKSSKNCNRADFKFSAVTLLEISKLRLKVVTVCNRERANRYTPNVLQTRTIAMLCNYVTVKFRYSIVKTDYTYYRLIYNTAY